MDALTIKALVPQIYGLVARLEAAAPGRSFAPDGHLLGSIGEVLAAAEYGPELTIAKDGSSTTVYNGPAALAWASLAHKAMPSNGQRRIIGFR
jgi:hypothetical protein